MKIINRSACLLLILLLIACSKDDKNEVQIPVDKEVKEEEVEEPKEALDLVNVEIVGETPVSNFIATLVHGDKLYATSQEDTYMYDFTLNTWTFLTTDSDTPTPSFYQGISFLRNGKWNLFTNRGLFEFDLELNDWQVIDSMTPTNELFFPNGFYIEAEEALYFRDRANGNETIYKYDLLTNELLSHGTYESNGDYGGIHNNTFVINSSNYILGQVGNREPNLYKFNDDFKELATIKNYTAENQFDGGVAMHNGDYIIFGLGGVPTADADGTITSDPSNLKFYFYDIVKNTFAEMKSSFYESCRDAKLVTYNNEFYLINGFTITNQKTEARNTMEKIEFDIVKQ